MKVRMTFVLLALLVSYGISHGKEERWNNFAEDSDLKYYLDQKTIIPVSETLYIFWVKSVAKNKEYFRQEYNVADLSYILTNYELDCTVASYRVRGSIMFDKNRRELGKSVADEAASGFEPVPPESMLELAQDELCVKEESADLAEEEELVTTVPLVVTAPVESPAAEESSQGELPSLQ